MFTSWEVNARLFFSGGFCSESVRKRGEKRDYMRWMFLFLPSVYDFERKVYLQGQVS